MLVCFRLVAERVGRAAQPVGCAAQGDLAQRGEIFQSEKVLHGAAGLHGAIHLAGAQALKQFLRFKVDKFDLIGSIKDPVGHALAHRDAGDGCDDVVQTFQMLDIHGRVDADTRAQQLLDILIALDVAAAIGVCVGQLVDEDELRAPFERRVKVEFAQRDAAVGHFEHGQLFQTLQERQRFRPGVRLDIAGDNVDAGFKRLMCGFEHGVGLADACGIAEKDFETPLAARLDPPQQRLGIRTTVVHAVSPRSIMIDKNGF